MLVHPINTSEFELASKEILMTIHRIKPREIQIQHQVADISL